MILKEWLIHTYLWTANTYIRLHTYAHIHPHRHTHTHMHTYTYTHACPHTPIHIHTHTHTHTHTDRQTDRQMDGQTHTHTHVHTYGHIHPQMPTHIHTHTHTHMGTDRQTDRKTRTPICRQMLTYTQTHSLSHTRTDTRAHTNTHTHADSHMHTHRRAHTHTHVYPTLYWQSNCAPSLQCNNNVANNSNHINPKHIFKNLFWKKSFFRRGSRRVQIYVKKKDFLCARPEFQQMNRNIRVSCMIWTRDAQNTSNSHVVQIWIPSKIKETKYRHSQKQIENIPTKIDAFESTFWAQTSNKQTHTILLLFDPQFMQHARILPIESVKAGATHCGGRRSNTTIKKSLNWKIFFWRPRAPTY